MSLPPSTLFHMIRAGYNRLRDSTCKECGASIAWFLTTNKKHLSVNLPIANEDTPVVLHLQTCPKRESLGPAQRAEALKRSREKAVDELCRSTGAQIVVAIYPDAPVMQWLNGLNPEDARNDLIAASNQLRSKLRIGIRREEA